MKNAINRKQAEQGVKSLLQKYKIKKVTISDIKKWIFESSGTAMEASNKYQIKCLNLFPKLDAIDEFNDVVQRLVDAWNFFPHKVLNGRSPDQVYRELSGNKIEEKPLNGKSENQMPKIIVRDREMEFDEFQEMLQEMQRVQKPFKKWINADGLPKYKKYLSQIVKIKKTCDAYNEVAEIFFQRVLHVGFIDLESIRPDFIRKEFPRWWSTHVFQSGINSSQVKKSLHQLFEFIELVYGFKI